MLRHNELSDALREQDCLGIEIKTHEGFVAALQREGIPVPQQLLDARASTNHASGTPTQNKADPGLDDGDADSLR